MGWLPAAYHMPTQADSSHTSDNVELRQKEILLHSAVVSLHIGVLASFLKPAVVTCSINKIEVCVGSTSSTRGQA